MPADPSPPNAPARSRSGSHPLDPVSAEEIAAATEVVRGSQDDKGLRFVTVTLREPDKERLAADIDQERSPDRLIEVVALAPDAERAYQVVVALPEGEVLSREDLGDLQPAMIAEEVEAVERLVKEHPDFRTAVRRRGIDDIDLISIDPLPAGSWGDHDHEGRRLARAFTLLRSEVGGNPYARPVEGVTALVDLHRREVLSVDDHGEVPIPSGPGEFRAERLQRQRNDIRPLEIDQPEGPSFEVDGWHVEWQKWQFRIGWTAREGLVLHTVGYEDQGRLRSILHRGSFTEMAVPYGDPSPGRYLHCPFDIGENLVGAVANSLELGCDCLGLIRYFDVVVCDADGSPTVIPNAICLHEEDYGTLWRHHDARSGDTEIRRSRRLSVSFTATLGNYDYGFYWYLYQDGSIEVEVKATGIVAVAAVGPGETPEHGQLVAPGVNGMIHQHLFNARLDFDLDGESNSVYELSAESVPVGPANPHGNAFRPLRRRIEREGESPQLVDPLVARSWLVLNENVRNGVGEPVGFRLIPGENVLPLASADSAIARRAAFAYKHFWATRFRPDERYASGDFPNQHPGGAGLPEFVAKDRSLVNEDIVVWYSFGLHHLPRPEDWPVMPTAHIGFKLKPFGFFDSNPALDVPPSEVGSSKACH